MKKILSIFLCVVAASANPFLPILIGSPPSASCPSTPTVENNTTATFNTFGASGRIYYGQNSWNDGGTPKTICKLGFLLNGNGSSTAWRCEIWTLTVGTDLSVLQATSSTTAGANWTTDTWVECDFPTPFTTSASVNYALVIRPVTALGGNDMSAYNGNTAIPGGRDMWSSAGVADSGAGNDAAIRIYYY